ncbi:MAG: hypothetical protein E6R04_01175 [Spirochaetes bacterium]|nr:MAG: hypothetical protein E6R04_01175 [Spirochaetota bacterium]
MMDGWFSELVDYVNDGVNDGEKPAPKRRLPRANQWWKNEFGGLFRVEKTRAGIVHGHTTGTDGEKYIREEIPMEDFLREFSFLRSFKR